MKFFGLRPKLQLRLRGLLLLVTVCAFACSFVATSISEGRRQAKLVVDLRALGCTVQFDRPERIHTQGSPLQFVREGEKLSLSSTPVTVWQNVAESQMFSRIRHVQVRDMEKFPLILECMKKLGRVESLSLRDTPTTEQDLKRLLQIVRLSKLDLARTKFPYEEIPSLRDSSLNWLCMARTPFTDSAICNLPESLEYLDLTHTRITNNGALTLVRLKKLKTLKLLQTHISETQVKILRENMPWCEIEWKN